VLHISDQQQSERPAPPHTAVPQRSQATYCMSIVYDASADQYVMFDGIGTPDTALAITPYRINLAHS
jgi:hypothetical protein